MNHGNRSFQSDSIIFVVQVAKVIQNECAVLIGHFYLLKRIFIGEWLWCSESNHFGDVFGVRITSTLALPVPIIVFELNKYK